MGARNVAAVVTHWAHLPGDSFKVLTLMALITLDRDTEPRYWGETEPLIAVIGRDGSQVGGADQRALQRAIRCLVDKGALTVDKPATRWAPATYRLWLTPTESVAVEP